MQNSSKKRSRLAYSVTLLFISLFVAICGLPTLLSTSWGKQKLISTLEARLPYQISIQELKLNWLGVQTIKGLCLHDKAATAVIKCDEINSSATLLQILFKKDFKELQITKPSVDLEASAFGQNISQRIPMRRGHPREASFLPSISWNFSLLPFSGHIVLKDGQLALYNGKTPLIRYYNVQADADLAAMRIDLSGSTKEQQVEGTFHLTLAQNDARELSLTSEFSNFPVRGIDALITLVEPKYQGVLTALVGPSLNLSMKGAISSETFNFGFKALSPLMQAQIQTAYKDGAIYLSTPGTLSVTFTPELIKRLEKLAPALSGVDLTRNLSGNINLDQFTLPVAGDKLDLSALQFKALIQTSPTSFSSKTLGKEIDLDTLLIKMETARLDQGIDAALTLSSKAGSLVEGITAQAKIENVGSAALSANGSWKVDKLSLQQLEGLLNHEEQITPLLGFSLDAQGSFKVEGSRITLTSQASSSNFSLSPTTISIDNKLTLAAPATLSFMPSKALQDAYLPPSVSLDPTSALQINIQPFSLALTPPASELAIKADISLLLKDEKPITLQAVLNGKELNAPTPIWGATVDAQDLSVALVDKIAKQDSTLTSLIGPSLNLHLEASKERVQVNATSQNLNIQGAVAVKDNVLFLPGGPLELYFTLDADGFAKAKNALTKTPASFELMQPSILSLTVSRLRIPLGAELSWQQAECTLDGGMDKFAFQEKKSGQIVKLDQLLVKLDKKEQTSPLAFQLSAKVATKEGAQGKLAEGKMDCSGSLEQSNDPKQPTLQLNATIEQLPSSLFDLAAQVSGTGSLAPLFGNSLDAKAYIALKQGTGAIQLNLKSPNTRVSVVAQVQNGILTLSEPVYAQVMMTEELTRPLLKEVNPLSISSISSSHPLTLEIQPQGFSLPLDNWKKLSLSKAKIELGQITCQNEGAFSITLGLLKSKQFSQDKELHLWFAPIEFSINQGITSVERTEILIAQTFEVALWGKLNLIDETVDMILGLTSQCLSKAFAIRDLPPDYVMQIPMTGKMNDVQINTKSATAKIAALLIWQQKSLGGGLPGVAGELLGRLATLPDKGSPAPAAKHPFPWETGKPGSGQERKRESSKTPSKKKSGIHKEDKPLKQLLKLLK